MMMVKTVYRMFFFIFIMTLFLCAGCGDSTHIKSEGISNAYPNANLLMSGDDLEQRISSGQVTVAAANDVTIIDTRSQAAYVAGHIPGAINVTWQMFCNFPGAKLKSISEVESILGDIGLTRTMNFVIYDDTLASWGSAGRIFWMLDYLGCPNIQVLNGGWDKWIADGKDTETGASPSFTAITFSAAPNYNISLTKDYIHNRLGDDDFMVIDSRTDEEYNGWQLYGEAREGHMAGAVQVPYAWFFNGDDHTVLTYDQLKELLESRGITTDKEVTSYCTAGIRSGFVYFVLKLMGYPVISNYDGSMWEWAADDFMPMEKMARYEDLVYAGWVKQLMDYHAPGSTSAAPANYSYDRDHKYLIFETQWGSFEEMDLGWADRSYLDGHIPGAVHSNSDVYENGYPRWFLLPEEDLKAAVGSMGITPDTTVVVYSNSSIFATRLWWILKYAGVEDVRLLNGGFLAWVAIGGEAETHINFPVPVTYDGTLVPEYMATTDYVEANYDAAGTLMGDVRTWDEFIGEVSGYGYVVNKGRIPGAVWAFNADNPDREYLDADGSLRSFTEVRSMWADLGIESTLSEDMLDKEVIFYCGSGYRSSLAFMHGNLMGYDNVRNYSDGWEGWSTTYIEDPDYVADPDIPGSTDEWIQDPSGRPIETGEP